MRKRLQNKYALSEQGVNDLIHGIISSLLLNLSIMLPMMLSFTFLKQYTDVFFGNIAEVNLTLNKYIGIIIGILIVMFIAAKNDYKKCNTKVYEESARSRIFLAEKLKTLPLSYFSKKDIADLSATMLSDATTYEQMFANAVPKIYGAVMSICIMFALLFNFDYRLALSLFWALPVAFLVFRLAKSKITALMKDTFDIKRDIIEEFQEGLNLVGEIKAYNREEYFIEKIYNKYDEDLIIKKKSELLPGTALNISFTILKLGMVYNGLIVKTKKSIFLSES